MLVLYYKSLIFYNYYIKCTSFNSPILLYLCLKCVSVHMTHKLERTFAEYITVYIGGIKEHAWRIIINVKIIHDQHPPICYLEDEVSEMLKRYEIQPLWILIFQVISLKSLNVHIFMSNESEFDATSHRKPPLLVDVNVASTLEQQHGIINMYDQ